MKKYWLILIIAAFLLAVFGSGASADDGYIISATMYGEESFNKVGYAKIFNDAQHVYVYFMMRSGAGWCIEGFQVHAGATLGDFPFDASSNLIPEDFDYVLDLGGCIREYGLVIPNADLEALGITPGQEFYLAVRSQVMNRYTLVEETSWAARGGDPWAFVFPGTGWEPYVPFTPDAWILP